VSASRRIAAILLAAAGACSWPQRPARAAQQDNASEQKPAGAPAAPGKLIVTVGKSLQIDSPLNIQRISVANGDLVEAIGINPKEVLINGKAPGETSLIIWQQNGSRLSYDLTVRMSPLKLDAVRQQIARDFPDQDINVTFDNDTAFVRGTVKDVMAADRVLAMVATLGKTVNLLRVEVPPVETQIVLKVRFANIDRAISSDLGLNLASGALNQSTQVGTGQYPGPQVNTSGGISLSDALNIFLFRKDLNLAATIKALESKRMLETLAEPNLMAINGKQASFVSGGEFPYPMVQGGASVGAVTIAFREFGIRINFLPVITPRGTIRLQVAPEVSALDYANAMTFQGFTIPALSTRRVQTEVELESGQSFVIAGLMDNTMTETLNKIPGLSSIPLLGKIFQSRTQSRNNSELLVIVTPEVVRPIPAGQGLPTLNYPKPFLGANTPGPLAQPGMDKTGAAPGKPLLETVPIEQLIQQQKPGQPAPAANLPGTAAPAQTPPAKGETGGTGK